MAHRFTHFPHTFANVQIDARIHISCTNANYNKLNVHRYMNLYVYVLMKITLKIQVIEISPLL